MVGSISARRSRVTLGTRESTEERDAWCVVRGDRGGLAGFMSDYAHDSLTSYVSAGHVVYGWQQLFDRYQKTYFAPGKSRDSLAFEEVRVRPLAPGLALCTARFKLLRRDSVTASGPFTLILQTRGDRWQILHDHTSSDPK